MVSMLEGLIEGIKNFVISNYQNWLIFIFGMFAGYFIIKIVNKIVFKLFENVDMERTLEIFIMDIIKAILWPIWIIFLLGMLGVNVTALVAGLGVVGFIVGFATKDALSNLASGMFILFNKPFRIREEVKVAGIEGKVRKIGMSNCIIITKDRDYVTVPNAKIWGNPIINYSRLKKSKKTKGS